MYRVLEWISGRAMTMAGWCYVVITALICFDIVARRLLGFSSEATAEITGYLMAVGMTWGLAGTLFERGHVRIDVLVQKMPLRVRVWLHAASLLALIVTLCFFTYGAWTLVKDSYDFGSTDLSALHTPLAVPQGAWAAGLLLTLLAAVSVAARSVRLLCEGDADGMDRMLMARTYVDEAAETLDAVASSPSRPGPGIAHGSAT